MCQQWLHVSEATRNVYSAEEGIMGLPPLTISLQGYNQNIPTQRLKSWHTIQEYILPCEWRNVYELNPACHTTKCHIVICV